MLDEVQENIKTLDKPERESLSWKKSNKGYEVNFIDFKCFHGVRLDPNSLYNFENEYRENELDMIEF